MFKVTKQLRSFSAAHRLIQGYQGKCKNLHGHNYSLGVTFSATELNEYGFVIDFDDIKSHFDQWVQTHWDHCTIVSEMDSPLLEFLKKENQDYFMIPGKKNTTVECLSEYLFQKFETILEALNMPGVTLINVRIYETEVACAEFSTSKAL